MDVQRQRVKFEGLAHESRPDGQCRVGVRLEWHGHTTECFSIGLETHQGKIRAAAAAALDAALAATAFDVSLDLVGVKAIRAFDGWVVVVRVNGVAGARHYRLLGSASCESEAQLSQTAVKALLDATNRVLEQYVAPDGQESPAP